MRYSLVAFIALLLLTTIMPANEIKGSFNYAERTDVRAFIDKMVGKHGFDKQTLLNWFGEVEYKQSIINAITRPAEKKFNWARYRKIFLKEKRIDGGVDFWNRNEDILNEAEEKFGVPAAIIVSIIGVETFYGKIKGSYKVIDALSTLGFDYPKRAKFFSKELEEFLLLAREQNQSALDLTGSYAGAMGYGQFIPSSYRAYAKDYDGDGFADIWNNERDAIWSVANYFKQHHWKPGGEVTFQVRSDVLEPRMEDKSLKPKRSVADIQKLLPTPLSISPAIQGNDNATLMYMEASNGDEYWIGLHNFYVITRYNHSKLYAMAVYQLSEAIKQRK